MQVLVINLARRPDRLASITGQLNGAGIPFKRVAAIDGSTLPATASGISGGMVACHRSHRLCWRMLLDSGDPYALILEDDVVLSRNLRSFLASPPIPRDADVVRLETMPRIIHVTRSFIRGPAGHNVHRLKTPHYGSAAYILAAPAAAALLERDYAATIPIDHLVNVPERGKTLPVRLAVYQVVPALAIQGASLYRDEVPPEMVSDLHGPLRPPPLSRSPKSAIDWLKNLVRPLYDRLRNVRTAVISFDA